MQASVGDRLIIRSHHVGERDRAAVILAVRGPDGSPPYLIRWDDNSHEALFFPSIDAVVEHLPATTPA